METEPPAVKVNLKDTILQKIQAANIQEDDWDWNIIQQIWQPYVKGYFDAYTNCFNNLEIDTHSEEYREKLLDVCKHNIWH